MEKWCDFVDFFIESFIKRKINKQKFKPNIHWSTDALGITARAHGRQESEASQKIIVFLNTCTENDSINISLCHLPVSL